MPVFHPVTLVIVAALALSAPRTAEAAGGLGARAAASSKGIAAGPAAPPSSQDGVDFSNMPVEDAVMQMFMLLSEDARKDMKDMLKDMDETRLKRKKLREAEEAMKKEMAGLRDEARREQLRRRLARARAERAALERKQQRVLRAFQRRHRAEQEAENKRERNDRRAALRRQRREEQEARERALRERRAALRRQRHAQQEAEGKNGEQAGGNKTVAPSPCPVNNPNCLRKPVGTFHTKTPPKIIGQVGGQKEKGETTHGTSKPGEATPGHSSLTSPLLKPYKPLQPGAIQNIR